MKGKFWVIGLGIVLVTLLTACGGAETPATLAAGETTSLRGGGGGVWVSPSGEFTEGLVVVGTGTASAEPEIAVVSFGTELRGDDPAQIVDQGARQMDEAIAAVRELGVSADDIRTTGYSLWVETVYDPETGTPTGQVIYHLSHYVEATLRDLSRVGDLLAAVVEAGANTISGVTFSVENPEELVEQARQQALEDAKARALAMAEGLGISVGKPILVVETGGAYPMYVERGMGGGGMGEVAVAAPSISPGSFSVSMSVQVVYEIP